MSALPFFPTLFYDSDSTGVVFSASDDSSDGSLNAKYFRRIRRICNTPTVQKVQRSSSCNESRGSTSLKENIVCAHFSCSAKTSCHTHLRTYMTINIHTDSQHSHTLSHTRAPLSLSMSISLDTTFLSFFLSFFLFLSFCFSFSFFPLSPLSLTVDTHTVGPYQYEGHTFRTPTANTASQV